MISSDTRLYIYEIQGDLEDCIAAPPASFIGLWNEGDFSYLFFTSAQDKYVDEQICSVSDLQYNVHEISYRQWQAGLPLQGLTVADVTFLPADHPDPDPQAILLDPSVVFGDGNHPTTLACLRSMKRIVHDHAISSMLDLGTGTGILSLAAAAMGVERVLAVDKNRLAVTTARNNVLSNSLDSQIKVERGEARIFLHEPFDLVAANLPFDVLRDLIPLQEAALHKSWIVSGISPEQGLVLEGLYQDQGYTCVDTRPDPPWVTFSAVRSTQ